MIASRVQSDETAENAVEALMSDYAPTKRDETIPFAPVLKEQPGPSIVADDTGRAIIALLQKAAEKGQDDCTRAMDLAHKLSFQLRAAQEEEGKLEAEVAHFRDRATRAEAWLSRIHTEIEKTFFQKKDRLSHRAPSR